MTCFWDAIRNCLNISEGNEQFICMLKNENRKCTSVKWNNEKFTDKQLEENFEHVKNFNEKTINNGYDCSICDPFLILICEKYKARITHTFLSYPMVYECEQVEREMTFRSDRGHFW